jgi:hypothetical protein
VTSIWSKMKTNDEMRAHFLVDESHGSHMLRQSRLMLLDDMSIPVASYR